MMFFYTLAATALSFSHISASVIRRNEVPVFSQQFADPSVIEETDGTWYAFGTAGNGKHVQVAIGDCLYGDWTLLNDTDALLRPAAWTTGRNTWAPDVRRLADGSYVMYYSGEVAQDPAHHCIGTAVSSTVYGPYVPDDEPFACDLSVGGSIDPSGFEDADGRRYVLYKIDGNSIGHGGSCGNTVEPIMPTPIILQEVEQDGVTKIGDPIQIFDRTDEDGPLVEAPSMVRTANGMYILFFSSGCYLEPTYNVNYATASSLTGPFERADDPMIRTGEYNLRAPGGATAVNVRNQVGIAYHANCPAGRCLHTSPTVINGREVRVVI
ncbi:glycoside hydrolase family 43 protein [Annulohypoxylon maeteangense]|uniref:glycoside hydrolase family 43 protein n=1 Tax=Annulohypoxylon maeteangense TaxID=1927788 RepID=UPI002007F3B8|nr:glycoside hydrolase family 43 protein [Annulohypoxylon maeteangense]KAI0884349.1 glycoside hydrolase family 43 protein [Annulohypoxylon maeteangense]